MPGPAQMSIWCACSGSQRTSGCSTEALAFQESDQCCEGRHRLEGTLGPLSASLSLKGSQQAETAVFPSTSVHRESQCHIGQVREDLSQGRGSPAFTPGHC